MNRTELKSLAKFLVNAKINGYASGREYKKLKDGGKEFVFKEGKFKYKDKYYGSNPFVGQESVFLNGKIIWAMNYYGKTTKWLSKKVYEFLRVALRKVPEELPLRGPKYFKDKEFEYFNQIEGNLESFSGIEKIAFKGRVVYVLFYHGGCVR